MDNETTVVDTEPIKEINDTGKEDEENLVITKQSKTEVTFVAPPAEADDEVRDEETTTAAATATGGTNRPRRMTIGEKPTNENKTTIIPIQITEKTFEHKKILTFSLLLNGLCCFLLIFAITGWSSTSLGLKTFYWSYGRKVTYFRTEYDGNDDQKAKITRRSWYGLQSFYNEEDFHIRQLVKDVINNRFENKFISDDNEIIHYSESDCTLNQCDECNEGGEISFILILLSFIFIIFIIILLFFSFIGIKKCYRLQTFATFLNICCICFTYSALGVYIRDCYYPANDNDDTQLYGPGLIISIIVAILLTFTTSIQIIDLLIPNKWE